MSPPDRSGPSWPGGARFAFTIFDDTDMSTLADAPLVYDLLDQLGLRITKSVWPLDPTGPPLTGGSTCEDPEYLAWVRQLQADGHEIGYHNASDHPATRQRTIEALDRFEELFGHAPRVGADHAGNTECVYGAASRLTGSRGWLHHRVMGLLRPGRGHSAGHVPDSPWFWGDVLRERISYWRSFTFHQLDARAMAPRVPYHDPARHYVNWWFPSTHAPRCADLVAALDPARLDELEAAGGVCIVYTHFGLDFVRDGTLDPAFRDAITALARRDGWFAPVSEVLDHLLAEGGPHRPLTDRERRTMELRWILDQARARAGHEIGGAIGRRRR